MYHLASSTMYPGLFTDRIDVLRAYYTGRGLRFMEQLRQSDTYAELFFELPGCKLKIQSDTSRDMPPAHSGYQQLLIAGSGEGTAAADERDPDGLRVRTVPYGADGVTSVGFAVDVPDEARYRRFLREAMPGQENRHGVRVGDTQFLLTESDRGPSTPICRRGFTYITLIVHDLRTAHATLVDAGAQDSFGITRLHDRCVFSFVRDPFGNWIEVVQYANLSGPLPDVREIEDHLDSVVAWREDAVPF